MTARASKIGGKGARFAKVRTVWKLQRSADSDGCLPLAADLKVCDKCGHRNFAKRAECFQCGRLQVPLHFVAFAHWEPACPVSVFLARTPARQFQHAYFANLEQLSSCLRGLKRRSSVKKYRCTCVGCAFCRQEDGSKTTATCTASSTGKRARQRKWKGVNWLRNRSVQNRSVQNSSVKFSSQ